MPQVQVRLNIHFVHYRRADPSRRTLATSQYLVEHNPKQSLDVPEPPACAHYFVDALSWMRQELEQGKLEGRLECPKCKTNVGKYAWQGMQCSCGDWLVPGISLAKSRVDEIRPAAAGGGAASAIRMPPNADTKSSRGLGSGHL